MSTLHDRLADLADDAPPALPDPGLWDVARGYHRRRRIGTVVVVAATVLALGLIGGLGWVQADDGIEPAAPGATPALPDTIWEPSRWLPGTDDEGPLGQLAATVSAERSTWTESWYDVAGISATTGEYRFLDLPDRADGAVHEVALSPDGRRVAYWYTGATDEVAQEDDPVVGAAVYDTSTGDVDRMPVATDHGLAPGGLTWADGDRLVLDWGQYAVGADAPSVRQGGSRSAGLWVWEPAEGPEPQRLRGFGSFPAVGATSGTGMLLLDLSSGRGVLALDTGDTRRFSQPGAMGWSGTAIDATGTRIAWPRGSKNPNDLHVGRVRDGEQVESDQIPGTKGTYDALAWIDPDHVAAVLRDRPHTGVFRLVAVDVRTGEQDALVRFEGEYFTDQIATDLLGTPTAERPEPPSPIDPRVLAGLAGFVLLLGLVLLLDWRRRARP